MLRKPLLFYTLDERASIDKYCKKNGLKPYKFEKKILDGYTFEQVVQYTKGGFIYDVLECSQCYSGYMITLIRLPRLSYKELLNVALTSKNLCERAGAIGMILKEYPLEFEHYLLEISERGSVDLIKKEQVKRIVIFINDFVKFNTSYILSLKTILLLCEKIRHL